RPLLTRLTRRPGGTFKGTRRDDRPGLEPLETEDFVFELLDAILLGADDLKQLPHQGGIFCFRNLGQSQWHGPILPTAMPFFPIFLRSYEVEAFEKLWEGKAWSVRVLDFPEAAKALLLEFLPTDSRFITPPRPPEVKDPKPEPPPVAPPYRLLPDEARRVVWTYIRNAARAWNGSQVGEVTSTVTPWPHQARTYHRLLDSWPCQMLIGDEVGLGKTITAGLFIRQVWLSGKAKRILILMPRSLLTQWQ